ncbi:MAG: hypothetical protein ACOYBD_06570 [Bilifractor sp.]|jgi:hypothetical protein
MNALLEVRERLIRFYTDYDVYIRPLFRFALAVITFITLNDRIGYMSQVNNLLVIIILSVICAILPINGIVFIGTLLIVVNSFGLNVGVGAFAAVLYLLMLLLYFRFVPKDALAIILTPVAGALHMPMTVPVVMGLMRGPVSAITLIFSVLSWSFVNALPDTVEAVANTKGASMIDVLQAIPGAMLNAKTILMLVTFVVVFLIVTCIRELVSSHAWEISIVVSAIIYLGLMIAGSSILNVKINLLMTVLETVLSAAVALVFEFFCYNADYSHTEFLQFEDDNNYYYVKVTPKRRPRYDLEEEESETEEVEADADEKRFVTRESSAFEKKFDGINLQSRLEESLKSLNTNQNGRENRSADTSRGNAGNADKDDTIRLDPPAPKPEEDAKTKEEALGQTRVIRK